MKKNKKEHESITFENTQDWKCWKFIRFYNPQFPMVNDHRRGLRSQEAIFQNFTIDLWIPILDKLEWLQHAKKFNN